MPRFFGRFEVDRVHFDQGKVAFSFVGHSDLTGNNISGAQIEFADLRRGDVDVVRARQVAVIRRSEKAIAFGKHFQYSFGKDKAMLFSLRLQDGKYEILFAHFAGFGNLVFLGYFGEFLDVKGLQLADVQLLAFLVQGFLDGNFLVA